jgi:hypothetical protein
MKLCYGILAGEDSYGRSRLSVHQETSNRCILTTLSVPIFVIFKYDVTKVTHRLSLMRDSEIELRAVMANDSYCFNTEHVRYFPQNNTGKRLRS